MTYSKKRTVDEPFIIGYTTDEHLLLDLDNTTHKQVRQITLMIMREFPEVGNALIVLSSSGNREHIIDITKKGRPKHFYGKDSFHIVFDNIVSYDYICEIIEVLVRLHILPLAYLTIRQFRGDMTLRLTGAKLLNKTKSAPVLLEHIHNPYIKKEDNKIKDYLKTFLAVRLL